MRGVFLKTSVAMLPILLLCSLITATGWTQSQTKVLDADVVIIGGGTAGMSAGVTALQKGAAKVVLLEKQPYIGGNSALAGGMLYSPTSTSMLGGNAATMPASSPSAAGGPAASSGGAPGVPQSAEPQKSSEELRDAAIKEALQFHHYDRINPKLLGVLIDKSRETTQWFSNLGIDANANAGEPGSYGKTIAIVAGKYASMGGQTLVNTAAKKILKNSSGRVSGVLAVTKDGKTVQIKSPTVILASGGFTGNLILLKKYFPNYSPDLIHTESSRTNMGEGIQLAADAGGALADYATLIKENGFSFKTGSALNNRISMNASLWVNKRGERFLDETLGHDNESANALVAQPGMAGYALYDEDQITAMGNSAGPGQAAAKSGEQVKSIKEKLEDEAKQSSTWVKISDNWEGIAAWIGADIKVLRASVEQYNHYCDLGSDPDFGKDKNSLVPLRKGPYYAVRFGSLMIDTVGPVIINERMEVLDKQGKSIPGFYAAGVITNGWQGHDYHLFGSALGLSSTGGRIAGENATKYAAEHKDDSLGAKSKAHTAGVSK
jgi:fumarate reductase flavoprotein subunit